MITHQLHSAQITGYYEYLSRIRQRVNVAPHEASDNEETTSQTTLITSPFVASVMNNDNTASVNNSSNGDNSQQQPASFNDKDVTKWSSNEVYQWVEEQCQKFELKKATTEKFQMNGQALVLLTKHDFLRRSPDGGEILYYALQRLINPNKNSPARVARNFTKNGSWRQSARIVELDSDTDEHNSGTGSPSSSKPIVEEPDDPPLYHKSPSDTLNDKHQNQNYSHAFFHGNGHIRQPYYGMPNAAFYHQQQAYPNGYMYGHHLHAHHVHPHMSQQQFFHPHQHSHYTQQFNQMMSAPGILIEVIDNEEAKNGTTNGTDPLPKENSTNGASADAQEAMYMVTINGQRYVMNEEQVTQYVGEVHRQQQQQQQQQHFQQQQQFHQQQQQQQQFHHHPQQQQQQFQQQQQQHRQTSQDSIFHNL